MSDDKIEVSGSGLKVSYLRFLADGAAGLLLIALVALAYYAEGETSGLGRLRTAVQGGIGPEAKVFLLILMGVMAVPAGLALNAIGWFLFGWIERRGSHFWFERRSSWIARGTWVSNQGERLQASFDLDSVNLYTKAHLYGAFLDATNPVQLASIQHVRGLTRMLRSGVLLSIVSVVYLVIVGGRKHFWFVLFALAASLICGLVVSILEWYVSLAVLLRVYVLTVDDGTLLVGNSQDREEAVADRLVRRMLKTARSL